MAVASAKQCGRAVVPEVVAPVAFDRHRERGRARTAAALVEPSASLATAAMADLAVPAAVTLAVGPEGGWTPGEVALAAPRGVATLRSGRAHAARDEHAAGGPGGVPGGMAG